MSPASDWWQQAVAAPDHAAMQAARRRQARLTKPAGSLGALETLAIRLAGLQGCACPRLDHVHISVFAADHGVAIENVSAFPQAVTAQMIDHFAVGGGAINVLARQLGFDVRVALRIHLDHAVGIQKGFAALHQHFQRNLLLGGKRDVRPAVREGVSPLLVRDQKGAAHSLADRMVPRPLGPKTRRAPEMNLFLVRPRIIPPAEPGPGISGNRQRRHVAQRHPVHQEQV